jgi:CRP-like cAMP-binding protein
MVSLRDFPLFAPLDEEQDRRWSAHCNVTEHDEHELIVDFLDESSDVRFIANGRVRVILRFATGREAILGEFGDGQFFGELAAIDGRSRSANVTAMVRTRLVSVPRNVFLDILRQAPEVAVELLRILSARIRDLNMRVAERSFLKAKYRLYSELLRLSRPRPGHSGERIVSPPPIQLELAERIGCSREQVSREMAALERDRVVERLRGGVVLKDVEELSRRISAGWNDPL